MSFIIVDIDTLMRDTKRPNYQTLKSSLIWIKNLFILFSEEYYWR